MAGDSCRGLFGLFVLLEGIEQPLEHRLDLGVRSPCQIVQSLDRSVHTREAGVVGENVASRSDMSVTDELANEVRIYVGPLRNQPEDLAAKSRYARCGAG